MHKKSVFRSVSSVGSVSLAILALSALTPAQAGFQWVPPESVEAAPVYAPAPAPIAAPDFPAAPQIIEGTAPKAQPLEVLPPVMPAHPAASAAAPASAPLSLDAMMEVPAPSASAAKPVPTAPKNPEHVLRLPAGMAEEIAPVQPAAPAPLAPAKTDSTDAPVRGFAKNVPLTVALRQILPSDYGFSVDQDISLGTQVSWQGGEPWRDVLTKMLAPVGLTVKEKDQLIEVVPAGNAASQPFASAPQPMGKSAGTENLPPAMDIKKVPGDAAKPTYLLPPPESAKTAAPKKPEPLHVEAAPGEKSMGFLSVPAAIEPPTSSATPVSLLGRDTVVDSWMANKGDTLHEVLKAWSKRANVELSWQAEYDFPLQASIAFGGTFEEAVRGLLVGFENATPQPVGTLHNNQVAGQTVLIIQTRGNKYTD